MPAGTIIGAPFFEHGHWCLAVRVAGDIKDAQGNPISAVEYIGRVSATDLIDPTTGQPDPVNGVAFNQLSLPQKKAALIAAVKAVRDADPQLAAQPATPNISGPVAL